MKRTVVKGVVLMIGASVAWGQIPEHSPDVGQRMLNEVVDVSNDFRSLTNTYSSCSADGLASFNVAPTRQGEKSGAPSNPVSADETTREHTDGLEQIRVRRAQDRRTPGTSSCAEPRRDCTLGEWASEAGFFVGGISGDRLEGPSVILDPEFASALKRHFNAVTAENVLKWGPLSPAPGVYDFERADLVVDFAEANGLRTRGHALVWARINGPPSWLARELASADNPAARLREMIEEHIATVVGRYRGRIPVWDVVNEPLALFGTGLDPDSPFTQALGVEYMDIAFRAARRADPDALLALNETLVITNNAKFDALLALLRELIAQGTPIDSVGLQGQFILGPPPSRADLRARLEAIAALGLFVEITELSIPIGFYAGEADPLAAQATAFADVFGACLDVPACTGVTTWGVCDAETWLDEFFPWLAPSRPLLLDETFGRKPAYEAVLKLFTDG